MVGTIDDSGGDAFVTKFTPRGNSLSYSTHLGGFGWDEASAIVLDERIEDWPIWCDLCNRSYELR